jgi:hypothetical protein
MLLSQIKWWTDGTAKNIIVFYEMHLDIPSYYSCNTLKDTKKRKGAVEGGYRSGKPILGFD